MSNAFPGASASRTLMLPELRGVLRAVPAEAEPPTYRAAIVDDNALGKPTASSRERTWVFLRQRFALDPALPLFRALRALWEADEAAQPLLAMLAALARDSILRATAPLVLALPDGAVLTRTTTSDTIAAAFPDRFAPTTLRSTAQNVNAAWTQSGHLAGKATKTRRRAEARPTAVAYALLLGHLCGERGDALFATLWTRALDAPAHRVRDLAAAASREGWIDYRHGGGVTEVAFRHLLRGEGASR